MNCRYFSMMWSILILVSFFAGFSVYAQAGQERGKNQRIMLNGIDSSVLKEEESRMLEIVICNAFFCEKKCDVVCPQDVAAVMNEQAIRMQLGVCAGTECSATDKVLRCDYTVSTNVSMEKGDYTLTMILSSATTGAELVKLTKNKLRNYKVLTEEAEGFVKRLLTELANIQKAADSTDKAVQLDGGQPPGASIGQDGGIKAGK